MSAALAGRRRGVITETTRALHSARGKLMWQRPGERQYRGELMREVWATPEHQQKIAASVERRRNDADELAAMRAGSTATE